MTDRIRSQHGNVIAADFRRRTSLDIEIGFKTETLFTDGRIVVMRTTAFMGDQPVMVMHFMGDLTSNTIVHI